MSLELFMLGVKIGLSVAAPIGPICLLCIRKSLSENLAVGIALALGTATADVIYAVLGAIGASTVTSVITDYRVYTELIGVAVIFYLGASAIYYGVPENGSRECSTGTLLQTYFSMVLITLTSPMTIMLFAGIFAGLGSDLALSDYFNLAPLAAGVFVSTGLWFTSLSLLVTGCKSWFNRKHLAVINTFAGVAIIGFAMQRLVNVLWPA